MMPNPYLFFFPVMYSRQFRFLVSHNRPFCINSPVVYCPSGPDISPFTSPWPVRWSRAESRDLFLISGRQQTGCDTYTG
jgi:hypothetical protein